jgi:hypothetical protein
MRERIWPEFFSHLLEMPVHQIIDRPWLVGPVLTPFPRLETGEKLDTLIDGFYSIEIESTFLQSKNGCRPLYLIFCIPLNLRLREY